LPPDHTNDVKKRTRKHKKSYTYHKIIYKLKKYMQTYANNVGISAFPCFFHTHFRDSVVKWFGAQFTDDTAHRTWGDMRAFVSLSDAANQFAPLHTQLLWCFCVYVCVIKNASTQTDRSCRRCSVAFAYSDSLFRQNYSVLYASPDSVVQTKFEELLSVTFVKH